MDRANRKMAEELSMAFDLQCSLLSAEFPFDARVKFHAFFLPASGDFYDVLIMPGGKIAFAQVDVSGHGVRSAMIGPMFKMSFQAISKTSCSSESFLAGLNDDMLAVTPDSDFLTVFLGVINPQSLELTYSNAGHPRPFLYRRRTGEILELSEGSMMIGAYPGMDYDGGRQQQRNQGFESPKRAMKPASQCWRHRPGPIQLQRRHRTILRKMKRWAVGRWGA
jgi:phosphoserine phosphatase RsbU/P